jgi:beta-lactamase superfamily II metal-dependent hydrolase
LKIGNFHLLFPGDAQWGTWQAILNKPELRELLTRTQFLKIGHHGSHNGTPREFIDSVIGKNFWAMVSTNSVKQWPEIPKLELLEAVEAKTKRFARSDSEEDTPKIFTVESGLYVEAQIPE